MADAEKLKVTKIPMFTDATEVSGFYWIMESNDKAALTSKKSDLFKAINAQQKIMINDENVQSLPEDIVDEADNAARPPAGAVAQQPILLTQFSGVLPGTNQNNAENGNNAAEPPFNIDSLWEKPPRSMPDISGTHPKPMQPHVINTVQSQLRASAVELLALVEGMESLPEEDRALLSAAWRLDHPIDSRVVPEPAYQPFADRLTERVTRADQILTQAVGQIPPAWLLHWRKTQPLLSATEEHLEDGPGQAVEKGAEVYSVGVGSALAL